jgi:hypothetical protein
VSPRSRFLRVPALALLENPDLPLPPSHSLVPQVAPADLLLVRVFLGNRA